MWFLFVLFWVSTPSSLGEPVAGLAALEPSFPPRDTPLAQAKVTEGLSPLWARESQGTGQLGASRAAASQAQELDAQRQHHPQPGE